MGPGRYWLLLSGLHVAAECQTGTTWLWAVLGLGPHLKAALWYPRMTSLSAQSSAHRNTHPMSWPLPLVSTLPLCTADVDDIREEGPPSVVSACLPLFIVSVLSDGCGGNDVSVRIAAGLWSSGLVR